MMGVVKWSDVLSFFAFGTIIVLVLGHFASLGLRVDPPDDKTDLSMNVADINGLVVGSNVLLRGVEIGKVSRIETTIQAATVDFYVDPQYQIPVDTEVRLENLSALGESYIGLAPRSDIGPMLRDGQRIATESVVQPPSISELATSAVRVLNQLAPGTLERIIGEADAALPDPTTVLPNISRASLLLRNMSTSLNGSGRALLDNFQTMLKNAEWVAPTLNGITPQLQVLSVAFQDLMKHVPALIHRGEPENLTNLGRLLARIQLFLDDRGPDLKVLGEAFLPKLNLIAAALMNFDTGQILDNMLAAVPADGTITLRVVP
jgi:phospholipid/cholesterol/gamma-HCH transport system substrate-binding protein